MSNITVFGNGYVGGSYADYFEENGYNVTRVDPAYGLYPTEECYNQASIVCVPAPTLEDGSVDYSIINDIIQKIEMPVMVKSTILPDYAECLDGNVVYSPEFLTATNAAEDIRNNTNIVIGGEDTLFWSTVFKSLNKTVHTTDARSASFMKYAVNTFLATKVVFMNQLHDQYNGDWNELKSLLKLDPRIGASHLDVPGPDGDRGFGGACFPKDVKAFLNHTADEYLQGMSVLHKANLANGKWR